MIFVFVIISYCFLVGNSVKLKDFRSFCQICKKNIGTEDYFTCHYEQCFHKTVYPFKSECREKYDLTIGVSRQYLTPKKEEYCQIESENEFVYDDGVFYPVSVKFLQEVKGGRSGMGKSFVTYVQENSLFRFSTREKVVPDEIIAFLGSQVYNLNRRKLDFEKKYYIFIKEEHLWVEEYPAYQPRKLIVKSSQKALRNKFIPGYFESAMGVLNEAYSGLVERICLDNLSSWKKDPVWVVKEIYFKGETPPNPINIMGDVASSDNALDSKEKYEIRRRIAGLPIHIAAFSAERERQSKVLGFNYKDIVDGDSSIGGYVELSEMIEKVVMIYFRTRPTIFIPKEEWDCEVWVKISIDGRGFGEQFNVGIHMQVLNVPFKMQSRRNLFQVAMMNVDKETRDTVKFLLERISFNEQLKKASALEFDHPDDPTKKMKVRLFVCADMKMFAILTGWGNPCQRAENCWICIKNDCNFLWNNDFEAIKKAYEENDLNLIPSIPLEQMVIDSMHASQRGFYGTILKALYNLARKYDLAVGCIEKTALCWHEHVLIATVNKVLYSKNRWKDKTYYLTDDTQYFTKEEENSLVSKWECEGKCEPKRFMDKVKDVVKDNDDDYDSDDDDYYTEEEEEEYDYNSSYEKSFKKAVEDAVKLLPQEIKEARNYIVKKSEELEDVVLRWMITFDDKKRTPKLPGINCKDAHEIAIHFPEIIESVFQMWDHKITYPDPKACKWDYGYPEDDKGYNLVKLKQQGMKKGRFGECKNPWTPAYQYKVFTSNNVFKDLGDKVKWLAIFIRKDFPDSSDVEKFEDVGLELGMIMHRLFPFKTTQTPYIHQITKHMHVYAKKWNSIAIFRQEGAESVNQYDKALWQVCRGGLAGVEKRSRTEFFFNYYFRYLYQLREGIRQDIVDNFAGKGTRVLYSCPWKRNFSFMKISQLKEELRKFNFKITKHVYPKEWYIEQLARICQEKGVDFESFFSDSFLKKMAKILQLAKCRSVKTEKSVNKKK